MVSTANQRNAARSARSQRSRQAAGDTHSTRTSTSNNRSRSEPARTSGNGSSTNQSARQTADASTTAPTTTITQVTSTADDVNSITTTTAISVAPAPGTETETTENQENSTQNNERSNNAETSPRPGAPPTYEESANHLTLEYGGYFLPYDSRPMPTSGISQGTPTLAPVTPSLSLSHMNPPRRTRSLQEAHHHQDLSPRGRRSVRRIGDNVVVPSDRVVTQPAVIDAEQDDQSTNGKCTKLLLPPMHICMATTCLVFNCVLPGSGTLLAAFGLFCCTKPEEWPLSKKLASNCLSLLVALFQLILTPVLLIGWIWSILWGFAYVGVSHQEYHGIKDDDDEEDEEQQLGAMGLNTYRHRYDDDDERVWAMDYHRYAHPYSAPSVRRMSMAPVHSGEPSQHSRGQRMLRATRSYGYVEVHGRNSVYHPNLDHFTTVPRNFPPRPTASAGSSSTNRPLSQTTLTSYINDGMFLPNTTSQTQTRNTAVTAVDM